MDIDGALTDSLNVALNEADWIYAHVRANDCFAELGFRVLTLPEEGSEPDEHGRMLRLCLTQVGRVAASLRQGRWDDDSAQVTEFGIDELDDIVSSFGGQPIYGWKFVDSSDESWRDWQDRLSLDLVFEAGATTHTLSLFQDIDGDSARHLDVCIWFGDAAAHDYDNRPISLVEVAASGQRWWDAFFAKSDRVKGHGMAPLKPDATD